MNQARRKKPESERWEGGYIRKGKKRSVFIIDRWVGGEHFHISTRCSSRTAAVKQLIRFEENPHAYRPQGASEGQGLFIDDKLVNDYAQWMEDVKGNCIPWINNVSRYLADWIEDIGHIDLRRVSLTEHLKPALDRRQTSRRHRIESIKGFYTWLRKEKGLINLAEDVAANLPVPQVTPEKHKRRKVVDEERLRKVYAVLPPPLADILLLLSATAWHVAEVRRFAQSGEIRPSRDPDFVAVLVTRHKSKDPHPTKLRFQEHLEAAQRIRARGSILEASHLSWSFRQACQKAGVERFGLGQMRHTVLTMGVDMGATPQQASEFAGHRSVRTTRRFYLDQAETSASIPVMRLVEGEKDKAG